MGIFTREPGTTTPEVQPYNASRPLRASAQVIKLDTRTEIDAFTRANARATAADAWQTAAWDYFDEVGEVKYAYYVMANTVSRIRIYPGVVTDPARPPQHVNDVETLNPALRDCALAAMRKLASGPGGIPTLLRDLALNLSVPGEGFLVQIPERRGSELPESWAIYSSDAVKVDASGNVALKMRADDKMSDYVVLPKNAFVGRIWRSHPRYAQEADSAMRGLLGLLEELMLLNRTVRATARSRLNAGLLYLPDGLSIGGAEATPYTEDLDSTIGADESPSGTGDDEDEFEVQLMDAMTTPIQDEDSAAAVVPLIVRGPAELGPQIQYIKFERSFDPALAARASEVLDRVLGGLDIPKEVVKGLADVKYCLSEDTEILTHAGWKLYGDLTPGEMALTLNHATGLSEWQPIEAINTFDVVDEPMLSIEQRGHSSLSTQDHRWAVVKNGRRAFATSADLTTTDRIPLAAPAADLPTEAKYTDAFVELVAWFWTEGAVHNRDVLQAHGAPRRRWVQITQSNRVNPQNVVRIRQALTTLYGPATAIDRSDPLPKRYACWTEVMDAEQQVRFMLNEEASAQLLDVVPGADKVVPLEFVHTLTRAQLELFIDASIEADGHRYRSGGPGIHQKIAARLDAFELACILTGRAVSRYEHNNGFGVRIRTSTVMQPFRRADRHTTVNYTGVVWCPTTENHTWLARRNGTVYYTGNSNAVVIDDQFFRSNVEPLVLMMVDALTTVYLRQFIVAHGFTREDADQIVTWYDPADVVVRPNRNQDATDGFDRYAVSAEAWRRTHGFSEDDAPDEAEVIQRLVIAKGQLPDALTETLLRVFAPEIMSKARALNPDVNSNLPPEVQQALGAPPSDAPAAPSAPLPTATQDAQPSPEPDVPAPPYAKPRQPDEPITAPPAAPAVGNPAA